MTGCVAEALSLHRCLLALRRAESALATGSCDAVLAEEELLSYVRSETRRSFLVVLNLGGEPRVLDGSSGGRVVLSTHLDRKGEEVSGALALRADEGVVVELRQS